ncbi:MAG TPA: hypothetical protein VGF84_02450 [Micromonosporaceae bacterium]
MRPQQDLDVELLRARLAGDREQAAVIAGRIFDDLVGIRDAAAGRKLASVRRAFVTDLVNEAFSPAKTIEIDELKAGLRLGGRLGPSAPELTAGPDVDPA